MTRAERVQRKIEKERQKEMKGQIISDMRVAAINRRCGSIYRNQCVKAEKLAIPAPLYTVEDLREFVRTKLTDNPRCHYCGRKLTPQNFELDHRLPLARGGHYTLENTDLICGSSNAQKGKLTEFEFGALLEFIASWPEEAKADVMQRLGVGGRWIH